MTVQEASYLLIDWFDYNDYFGLESNYTIVIKGKNLHKDPALIRSSLLAALESIEQSGLVKSVVPTTGHQRVWVLQERVEDLSQNVKLSDRICAGIYDFLTECASNLEMEVTTDPLNICEGDIESLLWALNLIKDDLEKSD